MKKLVMVVMPALLVLCIGHQAQATHTVVKSAPISTVTATVTGITQTLSVAIKKISDNSAATGVTFPAGSSVAAALQYVEVSFQSNTVGAAVIISTNNHVTGANPAFKSGPDGILGTTDDEQFLPNTGVSGAGLVGTASMGHGYNVPILWVVYDDVKTGGYTFTKNFAVEGAVTDKAQTHAWTDPDGPTGPLPYSLNPLPFDSAGNLGYASVIFGMTQKDTGDNVGLLPNFPAVGRSCTSPVYLYLGVDYTGAPAQGYATNTLALELINQ